MCNRKHYCRLTARESEHNVTSWWPETCDEIIKYKVQIYFLKICEQKNCKMIKKLNIAADTGT